MLGAESMVFGGQAYTVVPSGLAAASGDSSVSLTVNGKQFTVDVTKDATLGTMATLNEFIRTKTGFRGTKRNCGEGGCGACVVTMTAADGTTHAINSCLRPLLSCNGFSFTTTEGIGSKAKGYNKLQTNLAAHGGSQCGFCSPGFTMSMYGLLAEKKGKGATKMEIEEALHGNICRCTGFRPILAANHGETALRVEEAAAAPRLCTPVVVADATQAWIDVTSEAQLSTALTAYSKMPTPPADLMLVCGRTSQGIWKTRRPDVCLNIAGVKELNFIRQTASGWEVGSGTTITQLIEYVKTLAASGDARAAHMQQFHDHLLKVAATSIRNVASVGGNVMLTHLHQSATDNFAYSDVTTCLYGLGATLFIKDPDQAQPTTVSFDDFYPKTMTYSYLVSITIPFATPGEVFKTFRIAARAALSHPYVVGAFRCTLAAGVVAADKPVAVVLGGCDAHPSQKPKTAAAMKNIAVSNEAAFRTLAGVLEAETKPLGDLRVAFRQTTAVNFLYKFFLNLQPSLPRHLQSGAQSWFTRVPMTGAQAYDTDPSLYPETKPEPKMLAVQQVAGEVQYTGDLVEPANLLHLAPVLATAVSDSVSVDTSAAAKLEGYEGWYDHHDIGLGNDLVLQGPLLAPGKTTYIGQCIGLVYANSPKHATACARAVKVSYGTPKKALVNIDEAIAAKSFHPHIPLTPGEIKKGDAAAAMKTAAHVGNYTYRLGEQYHFHMETQTAMAMKKPDGFGLHVYAASQAPTMAAAEIASAIADLQSADVEVETTRCGGAYGGKIFNSFKLPCYTAAVCHKLDRPTKLVMEIDDNFNNMGMRPSWRFDAEVGYDSDGSIIAVRGTFYCDTGIHSLELGDISNYVVESCDNCYYIENWDCKVVLVKTDTPPNTPCRGPGFVPGIFFGEQVVASVAAATNLSEDAVRAKNYYEVNSVTPYGDVLSHWSNMTTILKRLTESSDYTARVAATNAFNAANTWTKRGISLTPVKYGMTYQHLVGLYSFNCLIDARADGSVLLSSSGVEVGQGLLTKVAEMLTYKVGVPEELIRLQSNNTTVVGDLGSLTGYSTTSELCILACENACDKLNAAFAPVRKSLPAGATWKQVAAQAAKMGVEMKAKANSRKNEPKTKEGQADLYQCYCAAVSEVEVDCLTGEVSMLRSDILYDAGRSLNPLVDVGQVEGGYLMGVGYALTEDMGARLPDGNRRVHNTWEYHVPTIADIPQVWNTGLLKGIPNPVGVMKTKATAEPPVCLGVGAVKSVSNAISAFNKQPFVAMDLPLAVDARQQGCVKAARAAFTFK